MILQSVGSRPAQFLPTLKLGKLPSNSTVLLVLGGQSNWQGGAGGLYTGPLPNALKWNPATSSFQAFSSFTNNSNPTIFFVSRLEVLFPGLNFRVVEHGQGGTGFSMGSGPWALGNTLRNEFLLRLDNACKSLAEELDGNFQLGGLYWNQGESDANIGNTAKGYAAQLKAFFLDVRSRTNLSLPVVSVRTHIDAEVFNVQIPRDALLEASNELIDVDDLLLDGDASGVHFGVSGYTAIGNRFADAASALQLQPYQPTNLITNESLRLLAGGDLRISDNVSLEGNTPNNLYLGNNFFAHPVNTGNVAIGTVFVERLMGLGGGGGVITGSNVTSPELSVSPSYEQGAVIAANQTGTITYDFFALAFHNGQGGWSFAEGNIYFTFWNNQYPQTLAIEINSRTPADSTFIWRSVGTINNVNQGLDYDLVRFVIPPGFTNIRQLRVSLTSRSTVQTQLTAVEYYPTRPVGGEVQAYLARKSPATQWIYGPGVGVSNNNGSQATLIGRGTLSANALPAYASDAAAAADANIPSGTFYVITGDTTVRRKP